MVRLTNKVHRRGKRAFTLVELIVVLVILAVLATMLVPALTGYIKKAKREKYVESAHYALVAAQSVMTEICANPKAQDTSDSGKSSDKYNMNWQTGVNKPWGDRVLELMDRDRTNEPYIFVFGVGSDESTHLSYSEYYTVYYIAYVETPNSPAVFYVNGEWMYTYPRGNDNTYPITTGSEGIRNTIVANGADIPLRFYIVSNRTGLSDTAFWRSSDRRSLEQHCAGNNGY